MKSNSGSKTATRRKFLLAAGATAATATVTAPAVQAQSGPITMRWQSTWPSKDIFHEYAIDFDCPVATQVLAARPGTVIAANAAAMGSGTTPDFLEYSRTNFVLVLHDDGTLGEYMHLSPSGVRVTVGQRVDRGDELALSGNTGYSSTPSFRAPTASPPDRAPRRRPPAPRILIPKCAEAGGGARGRGRTCHPSSV